MQMQQSKQDHYLWRMASLSEQAAARLSDEMFRARLEKDDATPENIITDVQEGLLADMRGVGIHLGCPVTDLLSGEDTQIWFLDILDYILPSPLYKAMRADADIVHFMRALVDGSITNGDLLPVWIDWICGHKPELADAVIYYRDRLVSSDLFSSYFEGLIENYQEEKALPIVAEASAIRRVANVHLAMSELQTKVGERLSSLLEDRTAILEYSAALQREFERVCINVEFCNKFGWWLGAHLRVLPITQRDWYRKCTQSVYCHNPMTREHYEQRESLAQDRAESRGRMIADLVFTAAVGKVSLTTLKTHYQNDPEFCAEIISILKE